jgi:hypothetical protein
VTKINVTNKDSIHHRLKKSRHRECDMAVVMGVDIAADMDVDMTINMTTEMDVDMVDDMDADNPCFHGPISSGPNSFGLLIISIQPIFRFQSIFIFQPIFKIESDFRIQPIF